MADGSTFRDPRFLREHLRGTLQFYYPTAVDERFGGYVPQLSDRDGHVYDGASKLVVATARLTFDFAAGAALDGPTWCEPAAEHGLTFLRSVHRDGEAGGYRWLVRGREPVDETYSCYGHAFVLFAQAWAARAGIDGAEAEVAETFGLLERFFEPEHGLYRSRCEPGWEGWADGRDQNPNMHACEAALAAHEATGENRYLDRAVAVADRVVRDLPVDGLVWETYDDDWTHDWDGADGYWVGHQLEWAKLLAALARHRDDDWLLARARALFDAAVDAGWADPGFAFAVDRDREPVDRDRHWWVHAEAVAAAALLGAATGEDRYWEWYDRVWAYVCEHLVAPNGNWYGRLTPDGEVADDLDRSPAYKSGYHVVNACVECLRALEAA